jgi:uncharacterized protein
MNQPLRPEVIEMIEAVFLEVRKDLGLGVDELKSALAAVEDFPDDRQVDEVQRIFQILRLLWCHGLEDRERIGLIEEEAQRLNVVDSSGSATPENDDSQLDRGSADDAKDDDWSTSATDAWRGNRPIEMNVPTEPAALQTLTPYPTKAPPPSRLDAGPVDWESRYYAPLSRRLLAYNWRYLRRFQADGAMDLLDVDATVKLAAYQGMFSRPIYRRREVNHVKLLLLVDQLGSMVPFHRYTRDVIETVHEDAQLESFGVYYFQNVPGNVLYKNEKLTQSVPIEKVLQFCDRETSVLILSDAGAARRVRQIEMKRVRATMKFLADMRSRTALICWLNPVPTERWWETSAELVARLVAMESMDRSGLSYAIDQLCGNPRRKSRSVSRAGGRSW